MITIAELTQTCFACPTQYSGKTNDDKEVYIRYRYGHLYITINKEYIKDATKTLDITWPE